MSILAGVYSKTGVSIPMAIKEAMTQALSRNSADRPQTHSHLHAFFAKVDLNAYGHPAFHIAVDGSMSILAGEPLLAKSPRQLCQTRDLDLIDIHNDLDNRRVGGLQIAQGVFCGAHYHAPSSTLTLMTDKLGVRTLYFFLGKDFVIFSTVLRVLVSLPIIPKWMDLKGVTEISVFGYPLANRTPFQGTFALRAAEVIQFSAQNIHQSQYWRWDKVTTSPKPAAELLADVHDSFLTAISRRLREDRKTLVLLSGGLDSRCVAAALRCKDVSVYSSNFAPPGTMDFVYSAEFARKMGINHQHFALARTEDPIEAIGDIKVTSLRSLQPKDYPSDRPSLVWTGTGGSVGVGHVYINRAIAEFLRKGNLKGAVNQYIQSGGLYVARRILKAAVREFIANLPAEGILEELAEIHSENPVRRFHLFLMLNDQRRHMADFYENIDVIGYEHQLPFYDSNFLQTILSVPVDFCLFHRFYNQWLKLFPAAVTEVPWQSYPGHEPCPLPAPKGLINQWNRKYPGKVLKGQRRVILPLVREPLRMKSFPDYLFRHPVVKMAWLLYALGFNRYEYVLKAFLTFHRYSAMRVSP
jgi:hypothetical protein